MDKEYINMIKVSIVVPIYNVQEYLGACLESLLAQTLKDIEIICINDGSTDDSPTILQCFAAKDSRIKIINKQNEGPGIARNTGIKNAQGEYIGFVDPDDWVRPDMYERLYNQAKSLNSDIVIGEYVRYQEWDNKIIPQKLLKKAVKYIKDEPVELPTGNIDREVLLDTLLVTPCYSWNRIYKRSFLQEKQLLFSEDKCFEDVPFILQSHIFAKKVSYLKYAGYVYRLRKTSTLRAYNKRYNDLCRIMENVEKFISEQKLSDRLSSNLHFFKVMNFAWSYNTLPNTEIKNLIKQARKVLNSKEYYEFQKYLQIRLKDKIKRFFGKFVSISNRPRHKVVKIFGITIKLKNRCNRSVVEYYYIKQVRKNYKKYPKDTYLLFDCLHDSTAEAIDAYSLFEQMREQGIPAYYVVRKQSTLYQKLAEENKLENIIPLSFSPRTHPNEFMKKIYEVLLRTKCIITSFGENSGTVEMFFSKHPSWQYVFIQHGTIFMKESVLYNGYLYPERFNKFLVCSDREEKLFLKYGFPKEKLIKVGLSRWDLLNNLPKPKEKSILLMLTWRRLNIVNFENSMYKKNLLKLLHNQKLTGYLKENNIKLYFAPHHAFLENMDVQINLSGENIEIIDSGRISDYIRRCSCLITDFSSVAFDFMFQHKPVIFYMLDKTDSLLNRFDKEDLAKFDYKQYILPNVLYDEQKVVKRLIEYCENNFEINHATQQIYDTFFYTKEDIREQLIDKLEHLSK